MPAFDTPTSSPAGNNSPLRRQLYGQNPREACLRRRVSRAEAGAGLAFIVMFQTVIVTQYLSRPAPHHFGNPLGAVQLPSARVVAVQQASSRVGDVALQGQKLPELAVVNAIRAGRIEWTDVAYRIHNELLDNGFAERRIGAPSRGPRADLGPPWPGQPAPPLPLLRQSSLPFLHAPTLRPCLCSPHAQRTTSSRLRAPSSDTRTGRSEQWA